MGTMLQKKYRVLHYTKNGSGFDIRQLDHGAVKFGEYKVWIYENNEVYFKESPENVYISQSGENVVIRTRDEKNTFIISRSLEEN